MVISKLQVAVFPLASVTTKVLVVVPTGKVSPEASPAVCSIVAEQLSLKVTSLYVTTAPVSPKVTFSVISAGQVIVGSSLSVTITSKLTVSVFPLASVAV